jgi:hypothetical protein
LIVLSYARNNGKIRLKSGCFLPEITSDCRILSSL